jgi:hypothetical protein
MGFLDVLRGKRELRKPTDDRLFAMSTAVITMQEKGLTPTGKAAIVFQPLATSDFDSIVTEMTELLHATGDEMGTTIDTKDDSFGYRFMILTDPDFEDLVVGLNAVNGAIRDGGYADRVLCAVFPFKDAQGRDVHWIYNVKRATYYPFAPSGGAQQRDNQRELQLKAQLESDLPIEADLARWFPLWDVPL